MTLVLLAILLAIIACWPAYATYVPGERAGMQVVTIRELAPVFEKAVRENAPWPAQDMKITDLRAYPSRIRMPKGRLTFEIEASPSSKFLGRTSCLITISSGEGMQRRVRVCGWIEVYRQVLCATRPMRKGDIVSLDNVSLVRRPLSRLRGQAIGNIKEAYGLALKRSIRAGQILTVKMLTRPLVVKRGTRVTIKAESAHILVRTPGKIQQAGAIGDYVKVLNIMSHREVVAKVLDSKTVAVNLN